MKIGAQRTLGSKVERVWMFVVVVAGIVLPIFGCEHSAKRASSKLPPTAETDPLTQPRSRQQVGTPVEVTRALCYRIYYRFIKHENARSVNICLVKR
jgi:hypothetical protein